MTLLPAPSLSLQSYPPNYTKPMTKQELQEIFALLETQGLRPRLCDTPVPYYDNGGMWQAMVAEGYEENTKLLTRAQVRTIVQFLGEP